MTDIFYLITKLDELCRDFPHPDSDEYWASESQGGHWNGGWESEPPECRELGRRLHRLRDECMESVRSDEEHDC